MRINSSNNNPITLPIPQPQKQAAKTSETLSDLPSSNPASLDLYLHQDSTPEQILQYTLEHQDCEWMEKQLRGVVRAGWECMGTGNGARKGELWMQGLDQLGERAGRALGKLATQRATLKTKLLQCLLLRSRQTHSLQTHKKNLLLYKQALLTLKSLHTRSISSQSQLQQLRSRLQTSCLLLVPGLIQRLLVRFVRDCLIERRRAVVLVQRENIRVVVEGFMGDGMGMGVMRGVWEMIERESLEQGHHVYLKFKLYILLKTYLDTKHESQYLDSLCQTHLSQSYKQNLPHTSQTEHKKILSLVQCNPATALYLHNLAQQHIHDLLNLFLRVLGENDKRLGEIEGLVERIVRGNRRGVGLGRVRVSGECVRAVGEGGFMLEMEDVRRILGAVEECACLMDMYGKQLGIKLTARDLLYTLLINWLKLLLSPLHKLLTSLNSLLHPEKAHRHYRNTRLIHRNILTWTLLSQEAAKNGVVMEVQQYMKDKGEVKEKEEIGKVKGKERNGKDVGESVSVGEFVVHYNEAVGEIYLYLANKLSNIVLQTPKKPHSSHPLQSQNLLQIWLQLIGQPLCDHLLHQLQPANILSSIDFLQNELIAFIDNEHRLEQELDRLRKDVVGERGKGKGKKEMGEEDVERTYVRVLELNLRVRDYAGLLDVCKAVGVDGQIRKMNQDIYSQITKSVHV